MNTIVLRSRPFAPQAATPGCMGLFFTLFALPFLAVGLGVSFGTQYQPLWNVVRARAWTTVPCVIERSEVQRIEGEDSVSWRARVSYRYRIQDRAFRSERVDFSTQAAPTQALAKAQAAAFKVGSEARCFVHPSRPEEAVLQRRFFGTPLLPILGAVFACSGAGLFFWGLGTLGPVLRGMIALSERLRPTGRSRLAEAGAPLQLAPDESTHPGPRTLLNSLGALLFATLSVLSVATALAPGDADGLALIGARPWVLGQAAVFALAAVLFVRLGRAGWRAFALPRAHLALSTPEFVGGRPVRLSWELVGDSAGLHTLQVDLVGREIASFKEGTDTRYEVNELLRQPVVALSPPTAAAGATEFTPPAEARPSFKSDQHEIRWCLELTATAEAGPLSECWTIPLRSPA